ncbi:MAG: flagellar basal body-associated FliL family protein [Lachnospiraceae bacterium]|nr:flagellar basal body-associated FliL family protein [Lachnospiraceae bacterium]
MKKGLLNLIILVLVITNVALTAILVFAVVPAMNATSDLVGKVAEAIDLEKELKEQQSDTLSIDQTKLFTFTDKMSILLKPSADGSQNYAQFQVVLVLDKEDENFSKYESQLTTYESYMRTEVNNVLAGYTAEELSVSKTQALIEIRDALRKLFNETEFIHSVGFSDFVIVPQ